MHFRVFATAVFAAALFSCASSTTREMPSSPRPCATGEECYQLGDEGWFAGDFKSAAKFYEFGCGLGHGGSCDDLGVLHATGRLGVVDDDEAFALHELACKADESLCANYAAHLCKQNRSVAEAKRGASLAQRSASLRGDPFDFRMWAKCSERLGLLQDAAAAYAKACELKSAAACWSAADLFWQQERWLEARQMHHKANTVFAELCGQKEQGLACANYKLFLDEQPDFRTAGGENLLHAAETSCAARPKTCVPGPLRPDVSVGDIVYVGGDAPLYLQDASTDGPSFWLADRRGEQPHPFQVLEKTGGWLRVATPRHDASACVRPPTFDGVQVAFWVQAEKLLPILLRDWEMEAPDGTSLRLRRGIPLLESTKPNLYTVTTPDVALRLYLESGDVGYSVRADRVPPSPSEVTASTWFVPSNVGSKGDLLAYGNGWMRAKQTLPVKSVRSLSLHKQLVSWSSTCMEATLVAQKASLSTSAPVVPADTEPDPTEPYAWVVKAETELAWGGFRVGVVTEDTVDLYGFREKRHGSTCITLQTPSSTLVSVRRQFEKVRVCFPETKREQIRSPWHSPDMKDRVSFCGISPRIDAEFVYCLQPPGTNDILSLRQMSKLKDIWIEGQGELDLRWVSQIPSLRHLSLRGFSKYTSLDALSGTRLESLMLEDGQIEDLSVLDPVSTLNGLYVSDATVKHWGSSPAYRLRALDVGMTNASDLSVFGDLSNLSYLRIDGTSIASLAPLEGSESLRDLHARGSKVQNLEPLSVAKGLEHVDVSDTQVRDLSPLASSDGLSLVVAVRSRVQKVPPLSNRDKRIPFAVLVSGSPADPYVSVCGTNVTRSASTLKCASPSFTDLSPLAEFEKLSHLTLVTDVPLDLTPLHNLKKLTRVIAPTSAIPVEQRRALHDVNPRVLIYHPPEFDHLDPAFDDDEQ